MTKGFVLAVGVPLVMGLVVSMVLLERVVKISVQPVELRHDTQVKGHLLVLIWSIFVTLTNWVGPLVEIGVDDLISPVVVSLLSEVLGEI